MGTRGAGQGPWEGGGLRAQTPPWVSVTERQQPHVTVSSTAQHSANTGRGLLRVAGLPATVPVVPGPQPGGKERRGLGNDNDGEAVVTIRSELVLNRGPGMVPSVLCTRIHLILPTPPQMLPYYPILETGQPRLRAIKYLALGHKASKWPPSHCSLPS